MSPAVECVERWLAASSAEGLAREPIRVRAARWWRRTQRTPAGDELWCDFVEIDVDVPAGAMPVIAVADGAVLRWHRPDKRWSGAWTVELGVDGSGALRARGYERPRRRWHEGDPWVRAITTSPTLALAPLPPDATTGRWWRLAAAADRQLAAAIAVAKSDTHFRRVGCWVLRPAVAAAVPADQRDVIARGRCGERHADAPC